MERRSRWLLHVLMPVIAGCVAPAAVDSQVAPSALASPASTMAPPRPTASPTEEVVPGCGPGEEIAIPEEYVPYAGMYGQGVDQPLTIGKDRALSDASLIGVAGLRPIMPREVGGLRLLGMYERDVLPSAWAFYHADPLPVAGTTGDFLRAGGVIVKQEPTQGVDGPAAARITEENTEGRRHATLVQVGEYEAALVYGDEVYPEVRPVGLYWSDGETDWSIRADSGLVSSGVVIDLARSMYCE